MADLKKIHVLHTTSEKENANTDAIFELVIERPDVGDLHMEFPDLPHNERERGRTDEYVFDVAGKGIKTESKLTIRMLPPSTDAWLPKTMWAIGETVSGNFEVLAAHTAWNRWFDRGAGAAGPNEHLISN